MNAVKRVAALSLLVVGMAGFARTTSGTTIKSASHYGPADPKGVNDCLGLGSACEAAQLTNQTFNIDGVTGKIVDFTTGFGQSFQVFDLGAVSANTAISLSFLNGGLLTCGFGNGALSNAVDSSGSSTVPGLPCTPIDDLTGKGIPQPNGSTFYSTLDAANNPVSFTTNADGSITFDTAVSDVVLWAEVSPTATPEPASVALLGTGLATLIGLRRRKR